MAQKDKKQVVKKKSPKNIVKHYKASGEKLEKPSTCPKCGDGNILAQHKDRVTCGKCHYTEFKK